MIFSTKLHYKKMKKKEENQTETLVEIIENV